jgi:hypothetical protein
MDVRKCYDPRYYSDCSISAGYHKTVGGYPSENPEKKITLLLPLKCIPKKRDSSDTALEEYSERIDFFKRLKNDFCVSYLVLDNHTGHLFPAIMAGWEKQDIILRIHSLSEESVLRASNDVDGYQFEKGRPIDQAFHAIYMDEPQEIGYPVDTLWGYGGANFTNAFRLRAFHGFVNKYMQTKFIITNFSKFGADFRAQYRNLCDEVIDDGYKDSYLELVQSVVMGSRTFLFSMSEDFISDNKLLEYIGWADTLHLTDIWLWFGNYTDCSKFFSDLSNFCGLAARSGWAAAREIYVETGRRYCKFSDCRDCQGVPYTNDDFWMDAPLGPRCPPQGSEYEPDTRIIQTQSNTIYLLR